MGAGVSRWEIAGGIGRLVLARPEKRNALSAPMRDAIVERLAGAARDDRVRVVVLSAEGPVFCAGFDRDEFASGMGEVFAASLPYHRAVYGFVKPLVAAVNGAALGGGFDLAAMCDLRVAAEDASFAQPQVRFGAPPLMALMRLVLGDGPARDLCFTGRAMGAAEALRLGFVRAVVPRGGLEASALAVAGEIAALPGDLPRKVKGLWLAGRPPIFEGTDLF